MHSIFGKILLWFTGTLLLAVVSFVAVSIFLESRRRDDPFASTVTLQVIAASEAYERGGRAELAAYLQRVRALFPGEYQLVDEHGTDLVSGADLSASVRLGRAVGTRQPPAPGGPLMKVSPDGRYRVLLLMARRPDFLTPLPYYAWIPIAIGGLCYLLAVHLASPARKLRDVVERFGAGDLSARLESTRRDEFGDLARAFDRMAAQIEQLIASERRLLQDVSHELRSPLARLQYAVELAREGDDREKALAQIRKDIDRLATLVAELVATTRGGEATRAHEVMDAGELVKGVLDDCGVEAEAQRCQFVCEVCPGTAIRGDRELLRRAVENVVRNAVRYAPAGTPIDVMVTTAGEAARISIRDRGPGVPADQLERIFAPFFRVETDRDRRSGGAGLGLAIAQRAVMLHHGRVSARNASPGLEVVIDLPLAADAVPAGDARTAVGRGFSL